MFRKSVAALICSLALASVVAAQDAKTVLNNVSKAMGYDQLKSIEYSGSGFEGTAMGQAQSAAKGWPHFTVKNFTRYVDVNAGTGQQTETRSRPAEPDGQLAGGGGLAPTAEAQNTAVIAANAGWNAKARRRSFSTRILENGFCGQQCDGDPAYRQWQEVHGCFISS